MSSHLRLAPSVAAHSGPPGALAVAPIRVVVADDHALIRRSVRLLLDGEQDVELIAEAGDLAGAASHVQGKHPHVLVLDLSMPGGSSIAAIGHLREEVPETQIVVMTMDDSPVFAQRALAAGALGYVSKEMADAELTRAVRAAAAGEQYVSPRLATRLWRSSVRSSNRRISAASMGARRRRRARRRAKSSARLNGFTR